jgi:hypothetical protein
MNKKSLLKCFIVSVAVAIGIVACNEVDLGNLSNDIQLDEKLVVPLGYTEATFLEFVEDSAGIEIYIEGDEVFWSVRDTAIYKMKQLQPQPFNLYSDPLPTTVFLPSETQLVWTFEDYFDFVSNENGEERIDSAYINSLAGSISLNITDAAAQFSSLTAVLEFDPTKITHFDGTPVTETLNFTSFNELQPVSLTNVKVFGLTQQEGEIGIPVSIKTYLTASTAGTTIAAGSILSLQATNFQPLDYSIAYGLFKPTENLLNINEDFDFNINDLEGLLKFHDPRVHITVKSNVGSDMIFDLDYLKAYKNGSTSGDTARAEFEGSYAYSFLARGTATPHQWRETTETFDRDHGATYRLFASENGEMPDKLSYRYSIGLQQPRDDNGNLKPMFITPDAELQVYGRADIPMWLDEGSYYTYKDTLEDVGENIEDYLDDLDENGFTLTALLIRLKLLNGLPVHAKCRIEFLDALGNEISKQELGIQDSYEIEMPQVTADGTVISPSEQIIVIGKKDKMNIDLIKSVKSIAFDIKLDGEKENIQYKMHGRPDSSFRIDVGLYVDGTYKSTSKE